MKNIDQLSDDQADQPTPQQAVTKFNSLVQAAQKEQDIDFFKAWNQTKTLWPKTLARAGVATTIAGADVGNVSTFDANARQVTAPTPIAPLDPDSIRALGLDPNNAATTYELVNAAFRANGNKLTPRNDTALAEAVSRLLGSREAAIKTYPVLFGNDPAVRKAYFNQ